MTGDAARGVVFVMGAAAQAPEPGDWRDRLAGLLRTVHGVVAVGAKRVDGEGRLFAMGDFVVHPKGFHHVGRGVVGHAYRFPLAVDAVSGGVVAVDAQAFDAAEGDAVLSRGPMGLVELCLRLRRDGGGVLAVPQVTVVDAAELGHDEDAGFVERWGFDWRAADLDAVRKTHGGTGLVWHPRLHASAMPFDKYAYRPAQHWTSYAEADVYRQRADHLAQSVATLAQEAGDDARVLDLGCGDGLFTHLVAQRGVRVTGIDPEAPGIAQAQQQTAAQAYPGDAPTFQQTTGETLPFADASFDVVYLLDVIEHLPNPVAVLREVSRVLKVGGKALITTPAWQYGAWSDPFYHGFEYTPDELARQVKATRGLRPVDLGRIGGVYRDIVLIAQCTG